MATDHSDVSITVGFDNESDSDKKGQIKITNDWGFRFGAEYRIRIWPSVTATVVTNYGIVYPISSGHQESGSEYVTFSNSDTASTEYPFVTGSVVQAGPGLDSEGNPIGVSFHIEDGQIKASQPFYGGAIVTYTSSYAVWGWQPVIPGSSWWNRTGTNFDYAIRILAFYEGATDTHDVSFGAVEVNDYMEAYKVTSEYIVDKDGGWELPPDWPTNNDYPNNNEAGPNLKSFQKLERTHEIMTVNTSGTISLDRQHVTWLEPYQGSLTWGQGGTDHVQYHYQKGSPRDGFESVFLDLNWDSIEDSVKGRYGGIDGF